MIKLFQAKSSLLNIVLAKIQCVLITFHPSLFWDFLLDRTSLLHIQTKIGGQQILKPTMITSNF